METWCCGLERAWSLATVCSHWGLQGLLPAWCCKFVVCATFSA